MPGNKNSALSVTFVLPFDPIFAGVVARTDCAGVSARADKRHRCGYFANPADGANRNFEAPLGYNSRRSFARCRRGPDCLIYFAPRKQERTTAPRSLTRLPFVAQSDGACKPQ